MASGARIKTPVWDCTRDGSFYMDSIKDLINSKRNNVYVDKNIKNNVYVDVADIERINEAADKHKAMGELLADKLGKPQNIKLYIKLSYLNEPSLLFEWAALALEAFKEGRTQNPGGYFYGIVRNLGKIK